MFNKMLILQVKEMMDRHWSASEIASKCKLDTELVLQIMAILNPGN